MAHTFEKPRDLAKEFIYNLNKLLFEADHYVSFKASHRSSRFDSCILYTSLTKWRFRPCRDMLLESKAWINYPHLLQEHSFKGYISDHNLWGLCFLRLLHNFTNTYAGEKKVQGVKSLYFNGLTFGITNVISQGSYFLINHPDEYSY